MYRRTYGFVTLPLLACRRHHHASPFDRGCVRPAISLVTPFAPSISARVAVENFFSTHPGSAGHQFCFHLLFFRPRPSGAGSLRRVYFASCSEQQVKTEVRGGVSTSTREGYCLSPPRFRFGHHRVTPRPGTKLSNSEWPSMAGIVTISDSEVFVNP